MVRRRWQFVVAAAVLVFFSVNGFASYSKQQEFRPATPAELAMKGVDSMPGASAAILDWVRQDDDNNGFSSNYYRIKVFTDEGKKWADVEIPYVPMYPYWGRVTDIEARTIKPDGTIVPFNGKVYDKVLVKGRGVKVHAKTFTLPDVQPGSIIEYRYQSRFSQNIILGSSWEVQHDLPLLHAKLSLAPWTDATGEYHSFFTYYGLPSGVTPQQVSGRFELEVSNIPGFVTEDFMPPEKQLRSNVAFHYMRGRFKEAEFWKNEGKEWTKIVEDFIGKPDAVKATAATLTGANPKETAKKIYEYVQKIRNYSYEEAKTEQEMDKESIKAAKNPAQVIKNQAGYSDEINRTYVALARAAGLQANVLRVAPRDERFFSEKLTDPWQLSDEVTVLTIDGQQMFVDPGTAGAPFGTVSWEKTSTSGMLLVRGSEAQWVKVPQIERTAATVKRVADLKMNEETLDGTITVTYTGAEALKRRLENYGEDEAAVKKTLEDNAKRWFPEGSTVTLKNVTGMKSSDDAVVVTYDVKLANLISSAGSRTLVPLAVFQSKTTNPFAPETRKNHIYYEHPGLLEDEVKLTVPDSFKVSALPQKTDMDAGALGYFSEAKAEGSTVTFKRTSFVNVMLIDVKNYSTLRGFYSAVKTADDKPLILVSK